MIYLNSNYKQKSTIFKVRLLLENNKEKPILDNDINALVLLQQQVRQPDFHNNRHKAISIIKQTTDPSLSSQKFQNSKYLVSKSQIEEKLKYHINRLERAETDEESQESCYLSDDSKYSLIKSENLFIQLEPILPQQNIFSFEDTISNNPKKDQPKTIDLDQNDQIYHLNSNPDRLGDKGPSGSPGQDNKIEGSNMNRLLEGKSRNKGKKYQGLFNHKDKDKEKFGLDTTIASPIQNKVSHIQSISKQIDSKDPKMLQ